jgi:SH3 domain protein
MKYFIIWLISACLVCTNFTAYADIRYITDELNLSLYELINSKGKLLRRLKSGTKLELLQEEGLFAEVRTDDGTVGWTKAGFLIKTKPARVLLEDLEDENNLLRDDLEAKMSQLSEIKTQLSDLKAQEHQSDTDPQDQLVNTESNEVALAPVQQENGSLNAQQDNLELTIPWDLALIAVATTFILGIVSGAALLDYRSRRRHGGVRIY